MVGDLHIRIAKLDFVSCPDGTLLGVESKLGNTDMYISSFVTDLV